MSCSYLTYAMCWWQKDSSSADWGTYGVSTLPERNHFISGTVDKPQLRPIWADDKDERPLKVLEISAG